MLTPTGFWSYATSDDESSRGRLSQLRSLLASELQQQIGKARKVNIFQDVSAIPPGADWERQIKAAIETSFFLIPIITPAFLESDWCCREVKLFQKLQPKFKGPSLIFPIHYVDVDHIGMDDSEHVDIKTFRYLKTLQWSDFTRLRLRNPDSEDVALFLESLAKGIASTLRKAIPVATPTPAVSEINASISDRQHGSLSQTSGSFQSAAPFPTTGEAAKLADASNGSTTLYKPAGLISPSYKAVLQGVEAESRPIATPTRVRSSIKTEVSESAPPNGTAHKIDTSKVLDALEKALGLKPHAGSLQERARNGDPAAQFELGHKLENGDMNFPKNERAAFDWYQRAAVNGHAAAQCNLAVMYTMGRGTSKNESAAIEWYRAASEQGNANAQFNLGIMLANGRGISGPDLATATHWYRKAAEQGHSVAQFNLATILANKDGVQKDRDQQEAVAWYRKAAEQGHAGAQCNLGNMLKAGRGVKKDIQAAFDCYRKAAELGNANGQFNQAVMLARGIGVKKDQKKAAELFRTAADQGHARAKLALTGLR